MTNKISTVDEFINDMSSNDVEYNRMINKSKEFVKKEVDHQCKDKKNTYYLTKHNYQYYAHFLNSDIFQLEYCLVLSQKGTYHIDEYCVNITNNELVGYSIDRINGVIYDRIMYSQKYIDNVNKYIIKLIDYLKTNNIIYPEYLDKLQNFEDVELYNINNSKTSGVIKIKNVENYNFVYVDYSLLKKFHESQFNHYIFYFNDLFKKSATINDIKKLKSFKDCKFVTLKEYIKTCTVEQYNKLKTSGVITTLSSPPFELYYFYPIEICKDVELSIKQPTLPSLPEDLPVRTDDSSIIGDTAKFYLCVWFHILLLIAFFVGIGIIFANCKNFYDNFYLIVLGFTMIMLPTISYKLLDKNINK